MSAISTFTFQDFSTHNIRVILINNEPWFVAKDICDALFIKNPTQALKSLDDDERAMFNIGRSKITGGGGETNIINESGMYALVMRSRDAMKEGTPQHRFRKWVTSEVLPSIRKTGGYHTAQTPPARSEKTQYLEHKDMQNIRDLVWQCSRVFGNNDAVTRAVWHAIRQVTGVPSPDKFQTQHLKPMAEEFLRILGIVESYTDLRRQTERDIIKQIIRDRGDGYQMQQIFMDLEDFSAKHNGELRKAIPLMFKQKCQRLIDRQ